MATEAEGRRDEVVGRDAAKRDAGDRAARAHAQGLERLNALSRDEARAQLLRCCGSERWARRMEAGRPYRTAAELLGAAGDIWASLDLEDWLEAFGRHPPIGGHPERPELATTGDWSRQEQAGMSGASRRLTEELERANRAYVARFGYVFLICATDRSAEDMLQQLRARLHNDPEAEIEVAAAEQHRITHLRLLKLLGS